MYRDLGMPEVERLAKAAALAHGYGPDDQTRESGYSTAPLIPAWWKFQEVALSYIAMRDADKDAQ